MSSSSSIANPLQQSEFLSWHVHKMMDATRRCHRRWWRTGIILLSILGLRNYRTGDAGEGLADIPLWFRVLFSSSTSTSDFQKSTMGRHSPTRNNNKIFALGLGDSIPRRIRVVKSNRGKRRIIPRL